MPENTKNSFVAKHYCKKELISKLVASVFVNIFFAFTLLFFSPLEVFMGNANEFVFSFGQIWWILLLVSLGGVVALTIIALILQTVNMILLGGIPLFDSQLKANATTNIWRIAYPLFLITINSSL